MFTPTSLSTLLLSMQHQSMMKVSLVPRPRAPPGEKRSGEQSRIPWAYYPKRVMTNEIARLVIITYMLLTTLKFVHLHSSIRTFFERAGRKIFLTLLGYNVAKGCASPRNSTWFTRPFLLVRGWGLGTRLDESLTRLSPTRVTVWPVRLPINTVLIRLYLYMVLDLTPLF